MNVKDLGRWKRYLDGVYAWLTPSRLVVLIKHLEKKLKNLLGQVGEHGDGS